MVRLYVSEKKIQPRSVHGWFATWRWVLVWATQLLYYGLPWLPWNGRQSVLFDLEARRFYIFDLVFYPQDVIFLAALLVISAFSLFFFTAVAGRLWCGYACPQTVYTEIFMWVEKRFEGDRSARVKLDAGPWTWNKLRRKAGKQAAWIAIAAWTGFTFVAYFTPARQLMAETLSLSLGPWEAFWIGFYGLATYGNAGYMREQVCKYMCPYARFQSAMVDRDTLVITYDPHRGEPRGSRPRSLQDPRSVGKGDCIDCTLCVQVCPTGIDIRNGLQYECIGCAACIDACDGVMDKMQYPRGLIRYDTQNAVRMRLDRAATWRRVARPRVLIYGAALLVMATALVATIAGRPVVRADVVRDRGALARIVGAEGIENVYRVQLMNTRERPVTVRVGTEALAGAAVQGGTPVTLAPAEARWLPLTVRLPHEAAGRLGPGAHRLQVRVDVDDAGRSHRYVERTTFVVPR